MNGNKKNLIEGWELQTFEELPPMVILNGCSRSCISQSNLGSVVIEQMTYPEGTIDRVYVPASVLRAYLKALEEYESKTTTP